MSQSHARPPRRDRAHVVFLFSDTGGGHRSASEAIIEALKQEYDGRITAEMVDIFKEYAPPPLELAPVLYPRMAQVPDMWKLGYRLSDGARRTRAIAALAWPYIRLPVKRLVQEHPCDLIVSVHQLSNGTVLRVLGEKHPPFVTVVTDMVTTHAFWYSNLADLILVPTEDARERGLAYGVQPEKMRVVGMPVALKYTRPMDEPAVLRERLGWPQDRPTVLLVGGGEGMGPIERIAHAIDESGLRLSLAVIAGRNRGLRERLENYAWQVPAFVYGFVREMPEMMRAATVLVSKAGPGTISEAFIAGLPLILYSKMPGQEDGNVDYVTSHGAGVWAPRPEIVVRTLTSWLSHPERLNAATEASRRLARPDATLNIARSIAATMGIRPT